MEYFIINNNRLISSYFIGISLILRDEIKGKRDLLDHNHYLCEGLDLYTTHEPDIMSCMALVHSRIKAVYFMEPSSNGGLETNFHIHTMPTLNHHYRAYRIEKVLSSDQMKNEMKIAHPEVQNGVITTS
jgi:tRNA(Arg) A34 adenosine deaminase TadA